MKVKVKILNVHSQNQHSRKKRGNNLILILFILYLLLNIFDPIILNHAYLFACDIMILGIVIFGFCFFFAQFLVKKSQLSPWQLCKSLILYAIQKVGPIYHIEDGSLTTRLPSIKRPKFCILNIRNSSAALICSDGNLKLFFSGIRFLIYPDFLFGYFSLDKHFVNIGPKSENPFASFNSEIETSESFKNRFERRHQTQAFTRDGVEIVPNIEFCIEISAQMPNSSVHSPAQKPESIRNISSLVEDHVITTISDIWRQEIACVASVEVFSDSIETNTVERIEEMLRNTISEWGLPNELQSLNKILQVQITQISLHNLRVQNAVEKQMIQKWGSYWLTIIQQEDKDLSYRTEFLEKQFQRKAWMKMAEDISKTFFHTNNPLQTSPHSVSSQLIAASIQAIIENPDQANRKLIAEISKSAIFTKSTNEQDI
jgi:hypothetical protein